jgi:hypothetical protein
MGLDPRTVLTPCLVRLYGTERGEPFLQAPAHQRFDTTHWRTGF